MLDDMRGENIVDPSLGAETFLQCLRTPDSVDIDNFFDVNPWIRSIFCSQLSVSA